jgi:hypothetical protein
MMARVLILFSFVVGFTLNAAHAQPIATTLEQLEGEWRVTYVDDELGIVSGTAFVDAKAGSVRVDYVEPGSGSVKTMTSSSLRVDGDDLVIELDGASPRNTRHDGLGGPEQAVVIEPTDAQIVARWRGNRAAMDVTGLAQTDYDHVQLVLKIDGDRLSGIWRYRSQIFIARSLDGRGRDGAAETDENGVTWTTGLETWQRPKSVVYGVIPLEDQLGLTVYTDGTSSANFAYPFGPEPTPVGRGRTLFIFGKDLPKDYARAFDVKGLDPGVSYQVLARPIDAAASVHYAELFAKGWEALRQRLEAEGNAVGDLGELSAILVEARLTPQTVPGILSLEIDGQEKAWLLQFGDNTAHLRVVRSVRSINPFESTHYLYPGEFVRVELETQVPLPVGSFNIVVGVDGTPLLLGDGTGIPAARSSDNPRIYRTDYIYLDPALAQGRAVDHRADAGVYAVPVRQGSVVTAVVGTVATLSIPPAMAQATVFESAGDSAVGGDWSTWLDKAIACTGDPTAADSDNADTITELLLSEFTSFLRFELPIWLETNVNVGQHAAMLMLRDTFVRLMVRNRAQLARLSSDEDILAFRRYLEPSVRQGVSPLSKVPVKSIDGVGETEFIWTFEHSILARLHDRRVDELEVWAIAATREALASYLGSMDAAVEMAQDVDDCDVEELLKITGIGFEPIVAIAKSKLIVPSGALRIPNYRARGFLESIPFIGEQLQIQERVGAHDTEIVLTSVSLAVLPVAAVGSAVGSMAAVVTTFIIDILDAGYSLYTVIDQKWAVDREVQFALGAAEVIGLSRFERVEGTQQSWLSVFVNLGVITGGAAFGILVDVPDIYSGFDRLLSVKKAIRGRAAIMGMNSIPPAQAGATGAVTVANTVERAVEEALAQGSAAIGPARQQLADTVAGLPARSRSVDRPAGADIPSDAKPLQTHLDDLQGLPPRSIDDVATHLDQLSGSSRLSQLDAGSLDSALDNLVIGFDERPEWAGLFKPETFSRLEPHLIRADVRRFVETDPARLAALLDNSDARLARIARQVLVSEPGFANIADFEARVNRLVGRYDEPISSRFYEQADDPVIDAQMKSKGWYFAVKGQSSGTYHRRMELIVGDPDGNFGGLTRSYDPTSGRFTFERAMRLDGDMKLGGHANEPVRAMIPEGPDVAMGPRGTPTMQFYTMKIMNRLGIKYGAPDGIKVALLSTISNARTCAQVAWFKQTYFPGIPWNQVPADALSEFLLGTHSARYAAEVLAAAGYRVKSATIHVPGHRYAIGQLRANFEPDASGETFEAFLARHDLSLTSPTENSFTIELEVEPWRR